MATSAAALQCAALDLKPALACGVLAPGDLEERLHAEKAGRDRLGRLEGRYAFRRCSSKQRCRIKATVASNADSTSHRRASRKVYALCTTLHNPCQKLLSDLLPVLRLPAT